MKPLLINYFICLLLVMQWSCQRNQEKQKELLLQPNYKQIENIISIADCDSPFGKYITEVHSFNDGSCYFHQQFNDNDSPFIVRLDSFNKGYLISGQDEVIDTLSQIDVEMIRGHEIHKMSINPSFFFDEISYEKQLKHLGKELELYGAKDKLNNPVGLLYDREKKLIAKIELRNPKDTLQTIEVFYDKWAQSEYGDMVKEIKIVQAKKDTFYFDFKFLKVGDKAGYNTVYNP